MKTFREECILHFPLMTPILTLIYSPQRNIGYSKLINGLGLVLVAYFYAYICFGLMCYRRKDQFFYQMT